MTLSQSTDLQLPIWSTPALQDRMGICILSPSTLANTLKNKFEKRWTRCLHSWWLQCIPPAITDYLVDMLSLNHKLENRHKQRVGSVPNPSRKVQKSHRKRAQTGWKWAQTGYCFGSVLRLGNQVRRTWTDFLNFLRFAELWTWRFRFCKPCDIDVSMEADP